MLSFSNFVLHEDVKKNQIKTLFSNLDLKIGLEFEFFNEDFVKQNDIPDTSEAIALDDLSDELLDLKEVNQLIMRDNLHNYSQHGKIVSAKMFKDLLGYKKIVSLLGTERTKSMFNAFSPIKIGSAQTPEQLALTKYEYPVQVPLSTLDGVDLNGVQQEELATLVFTDPEWKRSVRRILKKYKDYDFEGKRQEIVAAGNAGTESPISKFYGLHAELDQALNNVKERVKYQMKDYEYIKVQQYWQRRN